MTPQSIAAVLLALAVLAAWLRLWLGHRRDARRPRAWRLAVLVLLQPLLALALHATLFPPASVLAPGELTLLTEGASAGDVPEAARDGLVLALPEARAGGDVARVPDLGTALRQHPGTTRVHVVGAGVAVAGHIAHLMSLKAFDMTQCYFGRVAITPKAVNTRE